MVGTDGSVQYFLVQTSLTPSARSDERMVQLMRHLNRLLLKHKQTRRRHLLFHTPIIVPVWPQVRYPYMSWLILIMPLSTAMLNCAISFGKRRAGELFYSNRSA